MSKRPTFILILLVLSTLFYPQITGIGSPAKILKAVSTEKYNTYDHLQVMSDQKLNNIDLEITTVKEQHKIIKIQKLIYEEIKRSLAKLQ